jgi:hypothetical protein
MSACGSNPCLRGICQNKNETTYQCVCKPGFTGNQFKKTIANDNFNEFILGKTCDTSFDICNTHPCK